MPRAVSHSVDDFLESVAEAVAIVLLVSLLSLGLRTGMVVVISIPFVLAATALFMQVLGIGLDKVSLGTLILGLGLLVDDAIIAVEMMSVKLEQGWSRVRAAEFAYTSTAFPMLTGTLVTVSGFLPIALAKSSTGEYTRSIFQVSAIALLLSWLAAVVVIPLLGYHLLPEGAARAPAGGEWWRRLLPQPLAQRRQPPVRAPRRRTQYLRHRVLPPLSRLGGFLPAAPISGAGTDGRLVRDCAGRLRAGAAAVLPQFRPAGAAGGPAPAGRRIDRGLAVAGEALRGRHQGSSRDRELLQLRRQRCAALLPAARSATDAAQLRAVRDYRQGRRARASGWRSISIRCWRATSPRCAVASAGWRADRRSDIRCSFASTATISPPYAASPNRWPRSCAPSPARVTCSSIGMNRPSARCASRSTRSRRAQLGISSQDIAQFLDMSLSGYTTSKYRERDKLIPLDLRAPEQRARASRSDRTAGDSDAVRRGDSARAARTACATASSTA